MKKIIIAFGTLMTIFTANASAETWPTVERFLNDASLIVYAKTEIINKNPQYNNDVRYKIIEVLKGTYSPKLFNSSWTPPEGYLITTRWHGAENPIDGQKVIIVYIKENKDLYSTHSTLFPVEDNKLVYAPTSENGMRKEFSLEDFKNLIFENSK